MGNCTINLCPGRDIGVPTLVETNMVCGVGVPSAGVLGPLVTEPTLNCVELPAEVAAFFGRT